MKVTKIKMKVQKADVTYNLFKSMFASAITILLYWFWLKDLERDLIQLLLIIASSIVAGCLGSIMSRIITHNFSSVINPMNYTIRNILQNVFYGLLIWVGIITYLFETLTLLEICIALIFLKLFIFFASDYYADKISFGG
jgi:ABC-type uncharacterized transport system fused permease/ATPase subunit